MKFRLFSICALTGLLLSSCAVDELPAEGGSIIAEMETDQTRTSVTDEGAFTWSAGDQVWLHTTSGSVVGTLSSGAGTSSAKFTYGGFVGEMTGKAVYPYNDGHSVSGDVLNFVLPASYDLGSSLTNTNAAMYGVNVGGTIKFNHLAGVMRFKFKDVPAGVNKFTITLDKKINGTFSADLTADYPVIETSATSTASEKTITLNFNALTAKSDICVYVPLPVGTYNSLELGLYDDDQSVWTYSKSVTNTVNRKSLKLMPVVTLGGSIGGEIEGDGTSEESDFIEILSGSRISFPAIDPKELTSIISTNIKEFDIEIPDDATWITDVDIDTSRNDGTVAINITVDENMSSESRQATIKICKKGHHDIYKEIDIYQDKFNWYLSIDYVKGNSLVLDSGSHYGYVVGKLRTNLPEYTIRKDKEHKWIDIYIDSNNNVIVDLSNNPEPDMRIAEFYFYPSFEYSCCEEFKIAQKGTGE